MPSIDQFGLTLFNLREHLKTREDVQTTLQKVAAIGYRTVQVSGMSADLMPAEELRDLCGENQLTICGTHEPGKKILEETDWVIERLTKLGCKLTAYPHPGGFDLTSTDDLSRLIRGLDEAGAKMREAGLCLLYHNHAFELVRNGETTALERIYAETSPENVKAEIDVHWIQRGGASPEKWMRRVAGRQPIVHLKDFKVDTKNQADFAELGQGNLDLKEIVRLAEEGGTEWYIVEQDTCPGDPFESMAISFDYIQKQLAT